MAKRQSSVPFEEDDFAKDLIVALNKEFGTRVAYNLGTDQSPTHVKRWISTGSRLLDYACSNRRMGGLPEGRIIEIAGPPSIGKSHLAFHLACTVQKMGGLVVYIDTENAVPVEKLAAMGVDVRRRFVYADTHCTEEVFQIAEQAILKAKAVADKNIPILIVWDSVAATSPKQELENGYDDQQMGLQARVISKAMRKITGVIGQNNVTFLCLNQVKDKVGVVFGDPSFTSGGKAIPFHASVRIRLQGGSQIKDKDGTIIGINVEAKIVKNKVARPFRRAEFRIIFGKGIVEHEEIFDILRDACIASGPQAPKTSDDVVKEKLEELKDKKKDKGEKEKKEKKGMPKPMLIDGMHYFVGGTAQHKEFKISDPTTGDVVFEKTFYKSQFDKLLNDPEVGQKLELMLERAMVVEMSDDTELETELTDNPSSDGLDE